MLSILWPSSGRRLSIRQKDAMRRTILLMTLGVLCLCVARHAPAQPPDSARAARAQLTEGTVYYCTSGWDQHVVYFSVPFQTDELARTRIQEAYSQFLKQKYSYAGGASSVICSISESLTSAQSDKSGDEDSVRRAAHSVVETGWTYRGPTAIVAAAAAPSRSASPAAHHATPAAARTPAPTPPLAASAAPVAHAAQAPAETAAAGQHWWMCRYRDVKDPAKPVLGSRMYYALFPSTAAVPNGLNNHFNAYVQQNYKITDNNNAGNGYCRRVFDDTAGRANSMDMFLKQWASSNMEPIRVGWGDTPAEDAAIDAKLAGAASAAVTAAAPVAQSQPPSSSSAGGPFIACSTSGGAGIDTYLTGVFQTTHPVRHLPSGGDLVDQSVLDHFYVYLTQKGYKFKPGSNYACAVGQTEAGAEAAKHKRYYEGGACSNCGKTVETGWKDTP